MSKLPRLCSATSYQYLDQATKTSGKPTSLESGDIGPPRFSSRRRFGVSEIFLVSTVSSLKKESVFRTVPFLDLLTVLSATGKAGLVTEQPNGAIKDDLTVRLQEVLARSWLSRAGGVGFLHFIGLLIFLGYLVTL